MAYVINKSDGTALTTLQDATVDNSTSLTLVGRNYIGYGEAQNENYLFLLENFAHDTAPSRPIAGQLWFDNTMNAMKVYDGTKWVMVGATAISATPPENPPTGSFWYKTPAGTLHTWNGSQWVFIGPETAEGFGITRARSTTLLSDTSISYPVILLTVNDVVLGIMSSSPFTIGSSNTIPGFDDLDAGLTLNSSVYAKGTLHGNADTATRLETRRNINGVLFDGTADITIRSSTTNRLVSGDYIVGSDFDGSSQLTWSIDATSSNTMGKVVARNASGGFAAGLITADLAGDVTGSITGVTGTFSGTVTASRFVGATLSGNALTATELETPRNINGVAFDGTKDITVTASARTLSDNTIANTVIYSSLQTVGTLAGLSVTGTATVDNLTITSSGTSTELEASRDLRLIADDGSSSSGAKVIAPLLSTLAGTGPNGALVPLADGTVDLGKSNLKWGEAHANTFVGDLQGNADTATLATTATNIAGGAAGSLAYQTASGATALLSAGTAGLVLHTAGTGGAPYWAAATLSDLTPGSYMTGSTYDGLAARTFAVDATSANSASKVVARDSSGNFSAGTITADLSGNADTATLATTATQAVRLQTARTINGVSFNGTSNITITAEDPTKVNKSGSTMTGRLTLSADPIDSLHAATKQYVDSVGNVKAWVRFNNSGTIKGSRNVTSVTRLATGRYRINLTSGTMSDEWFAIAGITSDNDHGISLDGYGSVGNATTINSVTIRVWDQGGANDNSTNSIDTAVILVQ